MKVRFTRDVKYDGGGIPADAREFKAGEVVDLNHASARHWMHRHVADPYTESPDVSRATVTELPKVEPMAGRRNKMVDPDDVSKK